MTNTIEYRLWGRNALFSEPVTRVGGEKFSYQIPTYGALKGITESIYWKPTFKWVIDKVRVMRKIQTEVKGIRPIKYNGGNELSFYSYLYDVEYQVRAHLEWDENRPGLAADRNMAKHISIANRALSKGGRYDIFLGTRECQGYVEPCKFDVGDGFYDNWDEWDMGYMFHSFTYSNENPEKALTTGFWHPIMKKRGIIDFPPPDSPMVNRHTIREVPYIKQFTIGENMSIEEEEQS